MVTSAGVRKFLDNKDHQQEKYTLDRIEFSSSKNKILKGRTVLTFFYSFSYLNYICIDALLAVPININRITRRSLLQGFQGRKYHTTSEISHKKGCQYPNFTFASKR